MARDSIEMEILKPMNQEQFFSIRSNGKYIGNIWGTAKVAYHKELGYHVMVQNYPGLGVSGMFWIERIVKAPERYSASDI